MNAVIYRPCSQLCLGNVCCLALVTKNPAGGGAQRTNSNGSIPCSFWSGEIQSVAAAA
ncbi:hypothetical protein SynSYN20_02910 [Synechococcus sp. SYN20]|nr:hypothetical protein SynSYN20_02910 [Synechococcus sp. SYN20]